MKQILFPIAMLATCLLSATHCAYAQTKPEPGNKHGVGSRNITSSCDRMINGGFETQLATPSRTNNMGGGNYGTNRPDQLSNWYSPTAGAPDYFATNAPEGSEVKPNNERSPTGSFTPYLATSNNDNLEGAIGLYSRLDTYDAYTPNLSEYAQLDFGQPLSPGQYYVDFQVSLSHNTATSSLTNYGINGGFGLVFTSTSNLLTTSGYSTPNNYDRNYLQIPQGSQTVFNQNPIAQNSINYGTTGASNWQPVSGIISSTGELRYATLGLFNASQSNRVILPNGNRNSVNSYVFVDAIRLFKIPSAGQGISSCNSPVTIGEGCSDIPQASYAWRVAGSSTVFATTMQTQVNPSSTTTYTLTVSLPNNRTSTSSVTVTVSPPSAGPNKGICPGQSTTLGGVGCPLPGTTFAWTANGGAPFANTFQINVSPSATTTYTLTSSSPNGTTSTTSATVNVVTATSAPNAIYGEPQVCYDRTGDGRDRTTLTINTPAPTGFTYYSQLVSNATGQVVDDNLSGNTLADGTFAYFLVGGNYAVGNYTLRVRFQNGSCFGAWQTRPIFIVSCAAGEGPCTGRGCRVAYPNPASESLTMPVDAESATLINGQGQTVKIWKRSGELDVRSLPEGLYILRMMNAGKLINQRIQIKH